MPGALSPWDATEHVLQTSNDISPCLKVAFFKYYKSTNMFTIIEQLPGCGGVLFLYVWRNPNIFENRSSIIWKPLRECTLLLNNSLGATELILIASNKISSCLKISFQISKKTYQDYNYHVLKQAQSGSTLQWNSTILVNPTRAKQPGGQTASVANQRWITFSTESLSEV